MQGTPSEAKREVLERLLRDGKVQIMLDARLPGVDVPGHIRQDYQLRLNLSYRFNNHMEIDEEGIEAALTFKGEKYICRLPWPCIYMMVLTTRADPPFVFPNDMPPELLHLANRLSEEAAQADEPPPPPRPKLTVVHSAPDDDSPKDTETDTSEPGGDDDPPTDPPPRNHLRVVK